MLWRTRKLTIINGCADNDEAGKFTYSGARGGTVIDYARLNSYGLEWLKNFEVFGRVESD